MLGVNIDQTAIFIGVIVAIFGGVAAAFFAMSRSKRSVGATS
jgi:rRNA processing protein Gar1